LKKQTQKRSKPMTCPACDFNTAALSDASDQLQEALKGVAEWKRIWTTDSSHWYETNKKQADTISALIEGNKALRESLDKFEKFSVRSRMLL